jgi:predicted type IV restriction endonuclease
MFVNFRKTEHTPKSLRSLTSGGYNLCSPDQSFVIPSESNSERLTRKRLIDPKLKAAGWKIVPFLPLKSLVNDGPYAIEEFETTNGPAEYALCVNGPILGIVEAKKLSS